MSEHQDSKLWGQLTQVTMYIELAYHEYNTVIVLGTEPWCSNSPRSVMARRAPLRHGLIETYLGEDFRRIEVAFHMAADVFGWVTGSPMLLYAW